MPLRGQTPFTGVTNRNLVNPDDVDTMQIEDRWRDLFMAEESLAGLFDGSILDFPPDMVSNKAGLIVGLYTTEESMPPESLQTRRIEPKLVLEVLIYCGDLPNYSKLRRRLVNVTTLFRKVIYKHAVDPGVDGICLWYNVHFERPLTRYRRGVNNQFLATMTTFDVISNKGATRA